MRLKSANLQLLAPLTDGEVADRVIAGDSGAFELLMRRHNQRLFRTARGLLSDDTDAQDALQEGYIRIFLGLPKFEHRSSVATWMTRIVYNESIRFRTRRAGIRKRERCEMALSHFRRDTQLQESPMDPIERMQMFDDAMGILSDRERGVVMLRIIQGLSTRETAASLEISENNVKVSLFRAKPKLAAVLEESGIDDIRRHLSFDGERCDRLVTAVFHRLESRMRSNASSAHRGPEKLSDQER